MQGCGVLKQNYIIEVIYVPKATEIFLHFAFCILHLFSRSIKSLCDCFIFRNNSFVLRLSMLFQLLVKLFVGEREDLCGKQSGIDSSVYRNRSYRYAAGHLYGG